MLDKLGKPLIAAGVVFLVSFIVYLVTMDPAVGYIDSGELATVCATLGIAHPTGYPLFTLLGWVFSNLPIADTVIMRLNIMGALFTAIGAANVVLLTREIALYWVHWKKPVFKNGYATKKNEDEVKDGGVATLTGLVAGSAAAFALTWWQQGTSVEVYSLHILLLPLVIHYFLRMLRTDSATAVGKNSVVFAVLLGLAFTNHLTSIVLAPGFLYLYFVTYGLNASSFRKIAKLAVPFTLTLLIYLYLPIRASSDPILNWGDPSDWSSFIKHVTGGQYKIWMFTGNNSGEQLGWFFRDFLTNEYNTIFGFFSLMVGIGALILNARGLTKRILWFTLILFSSSVFYAVNYDIHDIGPYFLLAYLVAAVWLALGVNYLAFRDDHPSKRRLALATFAGMVCIWQIVVQYKQADESSNYLVEDYTRNLLTNLPKNAVIFSTQWDFWVSSALYYQLVEGIRPDVLVIDKHLIRDRPWYFDHLKQRAPEVMAQVKAEADEFLRHLVPFDRGDPFDQTAIGPAYQRFTTALIEKNAHRPIYLTSEMLEERDELFAPGMRPVAAGVAFTLNDQSIPPAPKLIRRGNYEKRGYYADNTLSFQAMPLAMTGERLAKEGKRTEALAYLDAALSLKPVPMEDPYDVDPKEREHVMNTDSKFAAMEELRNRIKAMPSTSPSITK